MHRTQVDSTGPDRALLLSHRAVLGFLAASLACWALAFLLWAQRGVDRAVLLAHNPVRESDLWVGLAKAVSGYGLTAMIAIYLVHLATRPRSDGPGRGYGVYLLVLLSFGIGSVAGDLLKEVFDRGRPIADYANELVGVKKSGSASFPSGHATKSVALFLPCLLLARTKPDWARVAQVLLAVLAAAICYARILLGKHYLSDILAALGTATLCFPLAVLAADAVLARMPPARLAWMIKVWAALLAFLGIFCLFL